ncbi:MAG: hypothetical protein ACXADW_23170 [Candidatus Hodarchaeales archaeon]
MKRLIVLCLILSFAIFACASSSTYKAYITTDKTVTALMEQYEMWYQMADEDQKAEYKEVVDPLFIELDVLMDDWHLLLMAGEDSDENISEIVSAINHIKSRILTELMKYMKEQEEE